MQSRGHPGWLHPTLGALFFISGFTGLLYQLVWLRLAFASFGIVTGVLSVVVAVFMTGLSLGSWIGGKAIGPLTRRTHLPAVFFYGASEFLIGIGAFIVPTTFSYGELILAGLGETNSLFYLLSSAIVLAISLFPWCFCMGTTFPFMMAFMKQLDDTENSTFSFLYACNVRGAMVGTLVTAFILIEIAGFRLSLCFAGIANFLIAAGSLVIGYFFFKAVPIAATTEASLPAGNHNWFSIDKVILFTTGLTSLAMEVVWTRAFTPVLGTQVYAFALLLLVYLLATRVGSMLYRKHLSRRCIYSVPQLIALLSIVAFLPLVLNDPQILWETFRLPPIILLISVMLSIFPYCAVLGYLTPSLIDSVGEGNPGDAGRAYAINMVGCILGPLLASYLLLPHIGAKNSMVVLALPFLFLFCFYSRSLPSVSRWVTTMFAGLFLVSSIFFHLSYEDPRGGNSPFYVVRRDHTATVISAGQGMKKQLLVNGMGITFLTPITKFMAHLPMAFLPEKPESALVICFGMGTTYRSLLSWGIQVTGVELVPSVKDAFAYFFDDANELLANPKGQIVIDDGRRFLKRTQKAYDVITIDPPPPVEAVGSGLLYSTQFYESAKQHLKPTGVLQQWFPGADNLTLQAVARSLREAFPYVKVYQSVAGWGFHFLASTRPLETPSPEKVLERMPKRAQIDLLEWDKENDLHKYVSRPLLREISIDQLLNKDTDIRITDDRPFNEYFLLRWLRSKPFRN